MDMPMDLLEVQTVAQTTKLLDVSYTTLTRLCNEGKLPYHKLGGTRLIQLQDVRKAMKERIKLELLAERNR
jgi:excisionase family DNA binding protein